MHAMQSNNGRNKVLQNSSSGGSQTAVIPRQIADTGKALSKGLNTAALADF